LGPGNDGHFLGEKRASVRNSPLSPYGRTSQPYTRSEESDDYHAVVARLNDRWRVVVCAAGIQWVLQRRAGIRHGTARWDGLVFCRTSHALNRLSRARAGVIDPTAAATLASLPDRIAAHQATAEMENATLPRPSHRHDADLVAAAGLWNEHQPHGLRFHPQNRAEPSLNNRPKSNAPSGKLEASKQFEGCRSIVANTSMPDVAPESKGDIGAGPHILGVKDVLGQPGRT